MHALIKKHEDRTYNTVCINGTTLKCPNGTVIPSSCNIFQIISVKEARIPSVTNSHGASRVLAHAAIAKTAASAPAPRRTAITTKLTSISRHYQNNKTNDGGQQKTAILF
jgi:hypothetical protein